METIPYHPLLIVTQEDMKSIRQSYEVDDVQRIRESLATIEEWIKKQPHLVGAIQYLGPAALERVFIIAKGSVEGTKSRLEKLLTSRGMMPEICLNRSLEEFEKVLSAVHYVPLPKLHPGDKSRIHITQFFKEDQNDFNLLSYFRYCFMLGEYRINFDYSNSERYVVDLKNTSLYLLGKINPVVLKKAEVICTEGIGTKIKGIHILNAPSFVDKFVFVLKQALREKVASRVHVHSSYEDFHKHIPKEILPKDYGGDEPSVEKLSEQWKDELRGEEAKRLIKEADKLVSDESKRPVGKFNEDYLGMPGSFRRLTVD